MDLIFTGSLQTSKSCQSLYWTPTPSQGRFPCSVVKNCNSFILKSSSWKQRLKKLFFNFQVTSGMKEVAYCNRQKIQLWFFYEFWFYITPTLEAVLRWMNQISWLRHYLQYYRHFVAITIVAQWITSTRKPASNKRCLERVAYCTPATSRGQSS